MTQSYDEKRALKVSEISEYIQSFLKEPHLASALAEKIMSSAEEQGGFDDDGSIRGEIASRYTTSGNPLPFTT